MGELRFAVLGPVRVWRAEEELALGSPQARLTLVALLMAGGRVVGKDQLLDILWEADQPRSALATLRTYVSRLRAVLGPGVIVSVGDGYMLTPASLDLTRFNELYAGQRFEEALALWQGEALAGLDGDYAAAQRTRLSELRLSAVEHRMEQLVKAGRSAEAIGELSAMCAAHPLRERLRGLLMRALYQAGRQAEAFGVYADTRRLLDAELGITPSAELAELHQRMLTADLPAVEVPATGALSPAQLPADLGDFTGRAALVAEMSTTLAPGRTLVVSALSGIGGVGKTTLAVHVAHQVRHAFPDGQLYLDLQGMAPDAVEPEAALGSFLRALGMRELPDGTEQRSALYRSALADRRMLVLLDNARDSAQVVPLLPGAPGCAVVVTSRATLGDLAGAAHHALDVLDPDEAMALFTKIVGEERVAAERPAAMDIVAACGFLPLAVRIAASRLAGRTAWSIARIRDRLAVERDRLDELRLGDLAIEATFGIGYAHLSSSQGRAFRLLAVADRPSISLPAAAAVLGLELVDAEDLCEALVDASMLESPAPGRYRYHDLLRVFALGLAEEAELKAARHRVLDFYLATATNALRLVWPGYFINDELLDTDADGLQFADADAAQHWVTEEFAVSLDAVNGCEEDVRHAVDLMLVQAIVMDASVHGQELAHALGGVLEAANKQGDMVSRARAHYLLAYVYWYTARVDDCEREMSEALRQAEETGDLVVQIGTRQALGVMARGKGQFAESAFRLEETVERRLIMGDRAGQAWDLAALSSAYFMLGDADRALAVAQESVTISTELGNEPTLAFALCRRGEARHRLGFEQGAREDLARCLDLARARKDRQLEIMAMVLVADIDLGAGLPMAALPHAEEAMTLMTDHGLGVLRASALAALGRALVGVGQLERGVACLREAHTVFSGLDRPEAAEIQALLVRHAVQESELVRDGLSG